MAKLSFKDLDKVDFTDPNEVNGYVSLLSQESCRVGMLDPDFKPSRDSNEIRHLANNIVRRLEMEMPTLKPSAAYEMTTAYDLAYRLAYNIGAPTETLNRNILTAFDAMLKGDKEVDEYQMYSSVAQNIHMRDRAYFGRPIVWLTIVHECWFKNFKTGKCEADLSAYDKIQQVAILLSADLFPTPAAAKTTTRSISSPRTNHCSTLQPMAITSSYWPWTNS